MIIVPYQFFSFRYKLHENVAYMSSQRINCIVFKAFQQKKIQIGVYTHAGAIKSLQAHSDDTKL